MFFFSFYILQLVHTLFMLLFNVVILVVQLVSFFLYIPMIPCLFDLASLAINMFFGTSSNNINYYCNAWKETNTINFEAVVLARIKM